MSENAEKDAPKFDWVTERSSCSLPKVFHTLRLQVEEDVKTRNGLRPEPCPYEFAITENLDDFSVVLKAENVRESVTFSLLGHSIAIRGDQGDPIFEVTAAFDEQGKCRLYVDEVQRDFWQVRRMALEDLMFRGN